MVLWWFCLRFSSFQGFYGVCKVCLRFLVLLSMFIPLALFLKKNLFYMLFGVFSRLLKQKPRHLGQELCCGGRQHLVARGAQLQGVYAHWRRLAEMGGATVETFLLFFCFFGRVFVAYKKMEFFFVCCFLNRFLKVA